MRAPTANIAGLDVELDFGEATKNQLEGAADYCASCAAAIVDGVIDAAHEPGGQQWASPEIVADQLYGQAILSAIACAMYRAAIARSAIAVGGGAA